MKGESMYASPETSITSHCFHPSASISALVVGKKPLVSERSNLLISYLLNLAIDINLFAGIFSYYSQYVNILVIASIRGLHILVQ
jgi:hypothetical protein